MTRLFIAATLLAIAAAPAFAQSGECVIKGNVNTKGERIYHVPGQKYYEETRFRLLMANAGFARRKKRAPPVGESRGFDPQ